jgi:hypothetical protein
MQYSQTGHNGKFFTGVLQKFAIYSTFLSKFYVAIGILDINDYIAYLLNRNALVRGIICVIINHGRKANFEYLNKNSFKLFY